MTVEREEMGVLQHETYVIVVMLGLTGAVSALVTNELIGTISGFTRGIFYATIALLASQAWLLHTRRARIAVVRELVYAGVSAILLSVLFYALYTQLSRPMEQVSLVSIFLWFPFVHLFIFMGYEGRGALLRSGLLYALTVCLSLPHAVTTAGSGDPFASFQTLVQFYIASASFIAVLYFFTRMKDQLRQSRAMADQMSLLARTDSLTGVSNRRHIEELLEEETGRAARYDLPLSLISFDLDDFKRLNDTLGHDAGDAVLVETARVIESCMRASDRFGRWGGEEFTIVATETAVEEAWLLADRVRTTLILHEFKVGRNLSASFGVATHRAGDSVDALIKRSDLALYRAKALGKNRVETESITA